MRPRVFHARASDRKNSAKDFAGTVVSLSKEKTMSNRTRNTLNLWLVLCGLPLASALSQAPVPTPPGVPTTPTLPARVPPGLTPPALPKETPRLTKFNLHFPGGNPHQLVAAIEKATSHPLNVVIPDEYADELIPALRMNQVTVLDLFKAMERASVKTETYLTSASPGVGLNYSYNRMDTTISFQPIGESSDDSVWFFRGRQKAPDLSSLHEAPAPPKLCRFYALSPVLDQGLKVEDITTAVQTGWKMLGDKDAPSLSFHKETKLLIAVGEPKKLETIDAVLVALEQAHRASHPAQGSSDDPTRSHTSDHQQ